MKLKEWLDEQQLKQVDLVELFATNGNEVTQGCINKWVNNERIPRKYEMQLITTLTNCKVTPNDFYDISC
jgi:hypothetical protein